MFDVLLQRTRLLKFSETLHKHCEAAQSDDKDDNRCCCCCSVISYIRM